MPTLPTAGEAANQDITQTLKSGSSLSPARSLAAGEGGGGGGSQGSLLAGGSGVPHGSPVNPVVAARQAARAAKLAQQQAEALADYYYSTADEKETDAIETICNSKSPINKAHAIYYFKNQEYFIDYCNEFVFLSNKNEPYITEYERLNNLLQREKFIAKIKEKDINLIKKTYNMLLCNIPSAKYDYYLYDCLREVIDDKELFYRGPLDDIFDNGLKKSHIFYYLQYIE